LNCASRCSSARGLLPVRTCTPGQHSCQYSKAHELWDTYGSSTRPLATLCWTLVQCKPKLPVALLTLRLRNPSQPRYGIGGIAIPVHSRPSLQVRLAETLQLENMVDARARVP
jgi:hypothetical protein